jgi:CHC2-type zinc finger protein
MKLVLSADNSDMKAAAAEIKRRIKIPDLGRKFYPGWKPGKSCLSPFRHEKNPSFSVSNDGTKFIDFGNQDYKGDVFSFYRMATGCDAKTAFKDLLAMAGASNIAVKPTIPTPDPILGKVEVKRQQFRPELSKPSASALKAISDLRSINIEGLEIAVERGFLWLAVLKMHPAWVLTDGTHNSYLARRLDGQPWEHLPSKPKAWLLVGSQAGWPIGIQESEPYPAIALCEGGPDFLAAFGYACASSVEKLVAPVCISSASPQIPDAALQSFRDKRVRIFVHDDNAGYSAAKRWALQLREIARKVDGYRFDGLTQADGTPVCDLNDLLRVDYDCWEQNREVIESVMDFATEGRK